MKPDLGLRHHCEGYDNETTIFFYGVNFVDISFVAPDLYSVMFEFPYDGEVYAMSFDFSESIFSQLLSKLPISHRHRFITSINGKRLPFTAFLPVQVTAQIIECHLGELQKVQKEEFVPFIITRIE
jgi:hypothetical protein